ncbi:MAG: EVE domain-containing protein [Cytophagaceae bacterium]|nr:EVE domain-containing protein [Cytophagaceae bacterium]
MNTYLFVWNPKRWTWDDIEDDIQQVDIDGKCGVRWSCGNTKSIAPGDRMFLVKVGTEPKGIVAAGFVTTHPFPDKHWNGENKEAFYIQADLEVLLNPEEEPILTLDILKTSRLASQNWTPQASGISIRPELVDELEAVWFDFLATTKVRHNPFIPIKDQLQKTYTEGTPNQVTLTKYERNPFARKACIEHYGVSCTVCGFNFEQVYGDLGIDFIHVHHLTQVAKVGKRYAVDPINDLRPVCPNCHAMLHKRNEGVSVEILKSLMLTKKQSA